MKLAVVIAAYNELETISPLTSRLIESLDSLADASWKLIYVIEGTDGTVKVARAFALQRPEIEVLYNECPSGLGEAFRKGFEAVPSDTDYVVTMDADLNHQPEEISSLLAVAQDSAADIVVGSRRVQRSSVEGMPLWKSTISRSANRIMHVVMGVCVNDLTSGFRVYKAAALRQIQFANVGFAFLPEILIDAAARRMNIVEHPIRFVFRTAGESKMRILATSTSYLQLFFKRSFMTRSVHKPAAGKEAEPVRDGLKQ